MSRSLEEAIARNHTAWFRERTLAVGGIVHQESGILWTYRHNGGDIAFPNLTLENVRDVLDRVVAFYRERNPPELIGLWSLDPPSPKDLGAFLLARGFQTGWRPHWMALDLDAMREDFPPPEGVVIAPAVDETWPLPYEDPHLPLCIRRLPGRLIRFGAWLFEKPVGQIVVFLSEEEDIAGIYSCGVAESARGRGIGTALTITACQWAQERGYHTVTLNATPAGERVYRRVGFVSIGYGWTWWLNVPRLNANPPSEWLVRFVEGVGRGDLETLESLSLNAVLLDAPLTNGMTPLEVAVTCEQPAAAEWLIQHGATCDVISAWDLGWRDRVPELLRRSPELANRRSGEEGVTPLHVAVQRNDVELVRVLLEAHPDLTIQDALFHSTPLGWARHFGHREIIHLLEKAEGHSNTSGSEGDSRSS